MGNTDGRQEVSSAIQSQRLMRAAVAIKVTETGPGWIGTEPGRLRSDRLRLSTRLGTFRRLIGRQDTVELPAGLGQQPAGLRDLGVGAGAAYLHDGNRNLLDQIAELRRVVVD